MTSQRPTERTRRLGPLLIAFVFFYVGLALLLVPLLSPYLSFRFTDIASGLGIAFLSAALVVGSISLIDRRLAFSQGGTALELAKQGVRDIEFMSESSDQLQAAARIRQVIAKAVVVRIIGSYQFIELLDILRSRDLYRGVQDLALLLPDPAAMPEDVGNMGYGLARFVLDSIENWRSKSTSRLNVRVSSKPISQTIIITDDSVLLLVPIGSAEPLQGSFIFIQADKRSEIRETCLTLFEEQWQQARPPDRSGEPG